MYLPGPKETLGAPTYFVMRPKVICYIQSQGMYGLSYVLIPEESAAKQLFVVNVTMN